MSDGSQLFQWTLNSINCAVAVLDSEGTLLFCNNKFKKIFKKVHDFYTGENFFEMPVDKNDFAKDEELRNRLTGVQRKALSVKSGRNVQIEEECIIDDKISILSIKTIKDSDESRILISINDYDSKKRQSEEMLHYLKAIENNLHEKEKMLLRAQKLQKNLNTRVLPVCSEIDIKASYMPSEELGGDFIEIFRHENKIIIILADCTGHGIEASMGAILIKSVSDRHAWMLYKLDAPDIYLNRLNNDYIKYSNNYQFPTVFCAVINTDTKVMTYASANGELPYLSSGGSIKQIDSVGGFHLGFEKDIKFEQKELKLKYGDELLFYSDSLLEFTSEVTRREGHEFLESVLKTLPPLDPSCKVNSIFEQYKNKAGGFPLEDDTTIALIRVCQPMHYTTEVCCNGEESGRFIDKMVSSIESFGYSEFEVSAMRVSFEEICSLTSSIESGSEGSMSIDFQVDGTRAKLSATVNSPFKVETELNEYVDEESAIARVSSNDFFDTDFLGGTRLAKKYMDDILFSEDGKSITLIKNKKAQRTRFIYF